MLDFTATPPPQHLACPFATFKGIPEHCVVPFFIPTAYIKHYPPPPPPPHTNTHTFRISSLWLFLLPPPCLYFCCVSYVTGRRNQLLPVLLHDCHFSGTIFVRAQQQAGTEVPYSARSGVACVHAAHVTLPFTQMQH